MASSRGGRPRSASTSVRSARIDVTAAIGGESLRRNAKTSWPSAARSAASALPTYPHPAISTRAIEPVTRHRFLPENRVVGETERNTAIREYLERDPFVSGDRKSTRLNSSHLGISYAVF